MQEAVNTNFGYDIVRKCGNENKILWGPICSPCTIPQLNRVLLLVAQCVYCTCYQQAVGVWRNVMVCVCVCVCERERERERIVKEEGKKAHVRRFFKSIYVPKNETCLFVLSKCKHDILIMFRFCALKEYSNLRHTTNRYTCVKYVLSHNDNYQCVSIALAIVIISAAAQQHKQYNKLPNYVSGTTERYNKCLKFSIWPQNVS